MNKQLSIVIVLAFLLVMGFFLMNQSGPKQSNMTNFDTQNSNIKITPIEHATMVLKWGDKIIYTDPVGGADAFTGQPAPDLILLTHTHPDHLDSATLNAVSKDTTVIIAPQSVIDALPNTPPGTMLVLKNGETIQQLGFTVEAIPMYNLPEKADAYHVKGDGNGYVVEAGGKRVYISGDTSGTPEMRNLKNIDIAFICMNLPYTMSVDEAADAVLAFAPKQVYPYHYKGTDGLSDVNKFKALVNAKNPNIDVVLLNWYPK
jgi:L-ascorbate metabolism protein UlaG (beta-lactamase superfamily)